MRTPSMNAPRANGRIFASVAHRGSTNFLHLLVFVLECVLVEIDRLWAIILRGGLLLVHKLIVNTLKATTTNVLSG